MKEQIKDSLRSFLPWPILYLYRKVRALPSDIPEIVKFLFISAETQIGFLDRLSLIFNCYRISYFADCSHMEGEMLAVMSHIFLLNSTQRGVIVEAGSYKGGSTAKISLAAKIAKRNFFVFDSFEGIPVHREIHGKNIFGGDAYFPPGSYFGSLEEVKNNVTKFGSIKICQFIKGFFEDTMPNFKEKVAVGYLDVDLASSTKTCIKHLYPLLIEGGVLLSQDGHLPWVVKLLSDDNFWKNEVGFSKPLMVGLGKNKLVLVKK